MPGQFVGPACYECAPARQISVRGPMFPWQTTYEVARQNQANPQGSQLVLSGPQFTYQLYSPGPVPLEGWTELDIQPMGTALVERGQPVTIGDIQSADPATKVWTPARARATWQLASGSLRCIDFDIGTGVTVAIPPNHNTTVDLLVPRTEGIDAVPIHPAYEELRTLDFATTVNCKGTQVSSPNPASRPRFTQMVYIDNVDAPPASATQQVRLRPYTRDVQVLAGPPRIDDPPLAVGDLLAVYRIEPLTLGPNMLPPPPPFPVTVLDFVTPHATNPTPVPGPTANIVRVSANVAAVRANVTVVQEIF